MLRSIHILTQGCGAEEFSIYLNYIRKLGFEETSNYNFLRELFAKVLKNNSDLKDSIYDWNLLDGTWLGRLKCSCFGANSVLFSRLDGRSWDINGTHHTPLYVRAQAC